jgi:hypothetical protein
MKYFTSDLLERLGSLDHAIADAAHDEWEEAVNRHAANLQLIRSELPASVGYLWDNFYLHDAEVLNMARRGQTFIIVLRLGTPPRDLLILSYELTEEPIINTAALPAQQCSNPIAWMYDEIDLIQDERKMCVHSILFSNGWEVQLRFRDLQVIAAQTLLSATLPQSA